jgi:chromosome segregation ATPase
VSATDVNGGQMRCRVCGAIGHDHCNRARPASDHGISPAQLREKVEALEKRLEELWQVSNLNIIDIKKLRAESDDALRQQLEFFKCLDAALKRIENLERDMADVLIHRRSGQP